MVVRHMAAGAAKTIHGGKIAGGVVVVVVVIAAGVWALRDQAPPETTAVANSPAPVTVSGAGKLVVAAVPVASPTPKSDSNDAASTDPTDAAVSAKVIGDTIVARVDPTEQVPIVTKPAAKPKVAPAPAAIAPVLAPRIDLVRVDKFGSAVVAGKAAPGADVDIILSGTVVATVKADGRGDFVALFDVPPKAGAQAITVVARDGAGRQVASEQTVYVVGPARVAAVTPAPAAKPAPLAKVKSGASDNQVVAAIDTPTPAPTAAPTPAPVAKVDDTQGAKAKATTGSRAVANGEPKIPAPAETPTETLAEAPIVVAQAAPVAPTIIIADKNGVKMVQPPTLAGAPPKVMANVSLDMISYDAQGEVLISGRGSARNHVRIYVNDKPVKIGRVDSSGAWKLALPEVSPGTYTLRVDEINKSGKVTSRVVTPFMKEDASAVRKLARNNVTGTPGSRAVHRIQKVTIQPGATLWALARKNYGEGRQYVLIFQANRDSIRDPNLIYPGQIFTIPE